MVKKAIAGLLSVSLVSITPLEAAARTVAASVQNANTAAVVGPANVTLGSPSLLTAPALGAPSLAPSLGGSLPTLAPLPGTLSTANRSAAPAAAPVNAAAPAARAARANSTSLTAPAAHVASPARQSRAARALKNTLAQQTAVAETAKSLPGLSNAGARSAGISIMDRILGERSFNAADSEHTPGFDIQSFESEGTLDGKHPDGNLAPASLDKPKKVTPKPPVPTRPLALEEIPPTTALGQWGAALLSAGLAAGAYVGSKYLAGMALTGALVYSPIAATVAAGVFAAASVGYLGIGFRVLLARTGTIEAGNLDPMKRPYGFFQKGGFKDALMKPVDVDHAPYMPHYAQSALKLHARVRAKAGRLLGFTVQNFANMRYLVGEIASLVKSILGLLPLVSSMYRGDDEVKPFVKKYKKSVWALQGINITQAVMGVATSYVVGALIDAATAQALGTAVGFAAAMVGIMLANAVLNTAYAWVKGRLTSDVLTDFRDNLFGHLLRLPFGFFSREKPSQVAARMSVDVANLATKNIGIPIILPYYGAMALFAGVMITLTSWQTTALLTLVGVPLSLIAHVYGNKAERLNEAQVNRRAEMISAGEETLGQVRDIRAFATEKVESQRYIGFVDSFVGTVMRKTRISSIYSGGMNQLYHAAFYLTVLFIGLFSFIATGEPTIGQTMAMVGYAGYMRQALSGSLSLYTQYRETTGSARRVLDYLKEKPAVVETEDAVDPGRLDGGVSFGGVDFSYDGKNNVLHDLNFDVEPGQRVALVGGEESGKSTLLDLIARLDDPSAGTVAFDGKKATGLKLTALRRQISLLHANGIWLDGKSVRENLTYGLKRDVIDEEILTAARKGGADFLENKRLFPEGLDTVLDSDDWRMSGARKKYLEIARAMLADPRIVLLDRPVAGLGDFEATQVEERLAALKEGRTSFAIPQRIEDAQSADVILVLKKGTIVERGTHEELMAAEGVYYKLYIAEKAKEAAEQ
jgi:ABC-type multidrug transport system fused ATPase/permease subunit